MLSINNLSKTFNHKKVLHNISLEVPRGGIALLLGASGVGKSTLLRVLTNLEKADAGTITLYGQQLDLANINRNHHVGMVFQQFNLFDHLTVKENITLPLQVALHCTLTESNAIAEQLLRRYGIIDLAEKPVSTLSGGQRQRLALARTLALKPTIICMDEPTSALDPVLTKQVAKHIQDLANEGYIILIATHDTSLIELLPATIYLMDKGSIIQTATTEAFLHEPTRFTAINQFVTGSTTY